MGSTIRDLKDLIQIRTTMINRGTLDGKKVVLGLSGGVDSTAAVLLLQEQGFQVTGYYFDIFGGDTEGKREAEKVAGELGIDIITEDVNEEFGSIVIRDFCEKYSIGKTPNPCVICNPNVKFRAMARTADKLGIKNIATGHYANVFHDEDGLFYICEGKNKKKDQSYMLYRLPQEIISRLIFPLGEIEDKENIRRLVYKNGISNAEKADSLDICFLPNGCTKDEYINELGYDGKPGNFINENGDVIAPHLGITRYTVGQRKGLGIATGERVFITNIDSATGDITLGRESALYKKKIISSDNVFVCDLENIKDKSKLTAKIRYGLTKVPVKSVRYIENSMLETTFADKIKAPAPGQSIVFYSGDMVVGGGIIEEGL